MAKSRNVTPSPAAAAAAAPAQHPSTPAPAPAPVKQAAKSAPSSKQNWDQVVVNLANHYQNKTPQRTKLIDAFMAFLVVVGALQFVYCVLAGNYVSRRRCRYRRMQANCIATAFQCFPFWFLCNSRAIRSHRYTYSRRLLFRPEF
jgi:hypothetical protein